MKSDFQQNYVREYLPQKLRVTCNWRGHVDLTLPRKGTSTLFSRAVFWPLRSHLPTSNFCDKREISQNYACGQLNVKRETIFVNANI